ncbi:MAG: RnfH family protein [Undibacterium sp.]|uniref:RnfH family protein n=1 Tax=Undibacterium sp. TaxID=1914977 RepID=UPI00272623B4|nr:RnfH family protein [Undibacterium sp.]MDO8653032.1 RnfH family protein [Undibacterium sp.]
MKIQVCYAIPQDVILLDLLMENNATLAQAIVQSQILKKYPEIDIDRCQVGVFGKIKSHDVVLVPGDRVEIYRCLVADPMEARRRRAKSKLSNIRLI